jgi:SAM-dependent methyltransferase
MIAAARPHRCPGCGSAALTDVFAARDQPVHVGLFGATADEARGLPTGDLALSYCGGCGLIHNRAFDPSKLDYRPGYEVALHHSPTFRQYVDDLVDGLTERFDLRGKRAVEIGCGDGYVLGRLAERAGVQGVGVDPTVPRVGIEPAGAGSVELIRAYFDESVADRLAGRGAVDFVFCLSAFEHVPQPAEILRAVRTLARDGAAGVYFDVFNARRAFERGEVWSPHYEQCNLFGPESLSAVFQAAGLEVKASGTCYAGDQYAYVDALAVPPAAGEPERGGEEDADPTPVPEAVASFADRYAARHAEWSARLADWRDRGRTAAFWGAAGKGVTFLNSLPLARPEDGVIRRVVDSSERKQSRFLPGTGHPIVAPETLVDDPPDALILSNALYRDEIGKQAAALGVTCDLYIA